MMSSEASHWKYSDFNDFQSWSWSKGSKLGAHRDGVENQKEPISIITLGNMKRFGICNYELEVLDRIPKKNGIVIENQVVIFLLLREEGLLRLE
eukprot:UN09237